MQTTNAACLGLYEKALPADLSWPQRLATAAELGFEFVEMSIDEQPARQQRLDWDRRQRLAFIQARLDSGVTVPSLCLSAHRRDPFGSADAATRERARVLMSKALELATDLGIRNIQLAGYDVYYEPADRHSRARFIEGMQWAAEQAARAQVMLSVEVMDTPFINSISKWRDIARHVNSPWFRVYPDPATSAPGATTSPPSWRWASAASPPCTSKTPSRWGRAAPGSSATCRSARAAWISPTPFPCSTRSAIAAPTCWRCGRAKTGRISNASPRPRPGSNNR